MILAFHFDEKNEIVQGKYIVWGGRHRTLAQSRLSQEERKHLHWKSFKNIVIDPRKLTTDQVWDIGTADN